MNSIMSVRANNQMKPTNVVRARQVVKPNNRVRANHT